MIYFGEISDACITVLGVVYFLRELLKIVCILIPIALIVMLSLDFFKGVISFDDGSSKVLNYVLKRIIYTIVIFLLPSTIFGVFKVIGVNAQDSDACWTYVGENNVQEIKKLSEAKEEALEKQTAELQQKLLESVKYKSNLLATQQASKKQISIESQENEEIVTVTDKIKIRLTSFSDYNLGAGINKSDSKVSKNKKGWYTYKVNGKKYLVVAAATKELKKSSRNWAHYNPKMIFQYRDTIKLNIEGTTYNAIILDSCGACMKYESSKGVKLDLWTSSESQNFGDYQYMLPA